jgi:hypothetical protein
VSDTTRKETAVDLAQDQRSHVPATLHISLPKGGGATRNGIDWVFEIVFDYGEHDAKTPRPNDTGIWRARQDAARRIGAEMPKWA